MGELEVLADAFVGPWVGGRIVSALSPTSSTRYFRSFGLLQTSSFQYLQAAESANGAGHALAAG